ncbi:hypothetical protein [Helicobacter trogontum]|uniref:hypothetical protein n=1 Tax=Helicobacter trogontum TaxID=50960 RepID=UPI002A91D14C|nr:hypothetical protein [Helicobacter trogontum]MDY5185198.1 hypothetical protein [Helicobacter trogontum]
MNIKRNMLFAVSICILLSILYVVLYLAQGDTTAHLIRININKHETISLYNREHKDTKRIDDYYTDQDIFLDDQIDKYVYSFTLSPDSKIFRKNFIYNIYPNFSVLGKDIEYAYMINHGDKFGNLVSTQKITENNIEAIPIIRSLNDNVLYWLFTSYVVILFVGVSIPICVNRIQNCVSGATCDARMGIQIIPPPPPLFISFYFLYFIIGAFSYHPI